MLAHRQLLARNPMVPRHARPGHQPQPSVAQVLGMDFGQALLDFLVQPYLHRREIPSCLRHFIDALCGRSFMRSYSSSRRTSSARGSSSSALAWTGRGSSMRDLISISSAAISRYSAASSS